MLYICVLIAVKCNHRHIKCTSTLVEIANLKPVYTRGTEQLIRGLSSVRVYRCLAIPTSEATGAVHLFFALLHSLYLLITQNRQL